MSKKRQAALRKKVKINTHLKPELPDYVKINVSMMPTMVAEIQAEARRLGQSVAQFMRDLIQADLKQRNFL